MNINFKCTDFIKPTDKGLHLSETESDFKANNLYFERAGKPILPVVGEFHFARFPREQWDEEIKKMKLGGVTVVSTYLMWIYHEEKEGVFDFSGDKDLHYFLEVCEKNDMLVLLRIGPWVHGEVLWGGFPEYIQKRDDKRSSSEEYLEKVRLLYRAYYNESKDFFYQNGSVVVGIQLENEYGGWDPEYIPALRKIAVEEGFIVPLYTVTAWPPCGKLTGDLLPTFGRYLERPWTQHTNPLPTDNRFRICHERIDKGIGSDILKNVKWDELPYDIFPYSTCELGIAVQVYEHRRPIMTHEDAYSVGVIQLAQGVNLLGYYLYHGCRNPLGRYQECKSSGYPNDVPISSYDFQTALSEYGYTRKSYHRLKLLHYLANDTEARLAECQPFFSQPIDDEIDYKLAVRMREDLSGYLFINNHQRLEEFKPIENVTANIETPEGTLTFPKINMPTGMSAVFPINMQYGPVLTEYATCQPVCHDEKDGKVRYFFFSPDGVECIAKFKGMDEMKVTANNGEKPVYVKKADGKTYEYYLLTQAAAMKLYFLDGKVFMSEDTPLNIEGSGYFADRVMPEKNAVCVKEVPHEEKKDEDYLFSVNEPKEFKLICPENLFDSCDDYKVIFNLEGNVAQLYCDNVLMADWFNYTTKWEVGLRRFRKQIENGADIRIVVSPLDKDHPVYLECPLKRDTVELSIEKQNPIKKVYCEF